MIIERLLEIEDISQGNLMLESLLKYEYFNNMPDEDKNHIRIMLNKHWLGMDNKKYYTCDHLGCLEPSCESHEISEGVFLKNLSDSDNNVFFLKRDIKGNPSRSIFDKINKRNATTFPGYCSGHDSSVFSDIEGNLKNIDAHFVNKQCLRSVRREKFDVLFANKKGENMINSSEVDSLENDNVKIFIDYIQGKISFLKKRFERLCVVYDQIISGIDNGVYAIKYRSFPVNVNGYCFNATVDLTEDGDNIPEILFFYKLDSEIGSNILLCTLSSDEFREEMEKSFVKSKIDVMEILYRYRNKIIMSEAFVSGLTQHAKDILCQDYELFDINPVDCILLYNEFFADN